MIELLMGSFAPWIMGGLGLIAVFFGVKSKVNSSKVKRLEVDNKVVKANIEVLKTELKLKEATDEIRKEQAEIDEVVIKSGADANRGKLSQHFTRD